MNEGAIDRNKGHAIDRVEHGRAGGVMTPAGVRSPIRPAIATGHRASVMVEGSDDEEWRKRLTAKLRQIPSLVLIDNLRRPLDSAALAAALTAPFWEDRVLGVSEITRLPIRCIWVATGNNPEFSGEMARRLVRIRLDARIDQPWRRSGFRHPNLMLRTLVAASSAKTVGFGVPSFVPKWRARRDSNS